MSSLNINRVEDNVTKKEMTKFARRRAQIFKMLNKGKTKSEISRHFGVSRQRIAQIIEEHPVEHAGVARDSSAFGFY